MILQLKVSKNENGCKCRKRFAARTQKRIEEDAVMHSLKSHLLKASVVVVVGVAVFAVQPSVRAQENNDGERARQRAAQTEYRAHSMVARGKKLLKQGEEERAVKLLSSVPRMYPNTKSRFAAHLVLGRHYFENQEYPMAVKRFLAATEAEDEEKKVEAIYKAGESYYFMKNYDKAFTTLRRVIKNYPGHVYANQAYFYIGKSHFQLEHWARAVAALKKVGTSVPEKEKEVRKAESGRRMYVKVDDEDLIILLDDAKARFKTLLTTRSGDKEQIKMRPLDEKGKTFVGSIDTVPGAPERDDGDLQFVGTDMVTAQYMDKNTATGKYNKKRIEKVRLVSTASGGFTDGAYDEYVKGVPGDQRFFMRVKDYDRDTSDEVDSIKVNVTVQYKVKKEKDTGKAGVALEEKKAYEMKERCSVKLQLTETGKHTGVFAGPWRLDLVTSEKERKKAVEEEKLYAEQGDQLLLEYRDKKHMEGEMARTVKYTAQVLSGSMSDVKIVKYDVDDPQDAAERNLIEAQLNLKLARVFKNVGLSNKAYTKAAVGLERANKIIEASEEYSLEQGTTEKAFKAKWNLLLVQDKLQQAITVCNRLIERYPSSTLVDKALMKIGQAKKERAIRKKDTDALQEAKQIFRGILRLEKSELKPEAYYRIAQIEEQTAKWKARSQGEDPKLSGAMKAYQKVAQQAPDSQYAGKALEKVANYYINNKDYQGAVELMERIFQDYPDANFLDTMLLKWAYAAYKMGDYSTAQSKCQRIINYYPDSNVIGKARKINKLATRKTGG